MSRVSGNDAVSYLHLADLFWGRAIWIVGGEDQIFDGDVTTAKCSVVKNGTKGEVSSYKLLYYGGRVIALNGTLDEDAPAIAVGLIVRDGTVSDGSGGSGGGSGDIERALDGDAPASHRCIVRDGAIVQRERAAIEDTAAVAICHIVRDGAIVQRERAAIEDTAAAATGGCVARDGAIVQREYAFVGDAAAAVATDKGCVARDVA